MFPTDAKLLNRARERLVRLATHVGVNLRQSYARVRKLALISINAMPLPISSSAPTEACAGSRPIWAASSATSGDASTAIPSEEIFAQPLSLSRRVLAQDQRQRGSKVCSLRAPEVECIGKGRAHRPYEFGIKVSVATTARRSKGGQLVTHVAALPGNPYDGHTLATVIPAIEDMIGNTIERLLADAGYRGHNAPTDYKFRIYTSGQKRRLTPQIKRELRRRAAIEPVIGHLKAEHRMGRNYLAHHAAMPLTPCSQRPPTTSISCLDGWSSCCLDSWRPKMPRPSCNGSENRKLHIE
jgi:IS5 family transposase